MSEETVENRFKKYQSQMFIRSYYDWLKNEELCNEFLEDIDAQKMAIEVIQNKWHEDIFESTILVSELLLWTQKVDSTILEEIKEKVLSNPKLAVARSEMHNRELIDLLLMDTSIPLTEKQKQFILNIVYDERYRKSIYDMRYYALRNDSYTDSEKGKILNDFYDSNYYDDFIDQLCLDITNDSMIDNDAFVDFYDVLDEDLELIKARLQIHPRKEMLISDIEFVRKLVALRKPNWLKTPEKVLVNV